jgi:hypothetical protein
MLNLQIAGDPSCANTRTESQLQMATVPLMNTHCKLRNNKSATPNLTVFTLVGKNDEEGQTTSFPRYYFHLQDQLAHGAGPRHTCWQ